MLTPWVSMTTSTLSWNPGRHSNSATSLATTPTPSAGRYGPRCCCICSCAKRRTSTDGGTVLHALPWCVRRCASGCSFGSCCDVMGQQTEDCSCWKLRAPHGPRLCVSGDIVAWNGACLICQVNPPEFELDLRHFSARSSCDFKLCNSFGMAYEKVLMSFYFIYILNVIIL